jgi:hypothetical protein
VGITRSLNAYSQSFLSNLSRVVSHSHSWCVNGTLRVSSQISHRSETSRV